jgi:LuxR family maltose regulon positive regulatory protein
MQRKINRRRRAQDDAHQEQSEGWAAGLQMGAISIKDSDDPVGVPGRIDLRGRTVAGYFLEEVLYREPPDVIDFMLATSVLDEMSTAACTALCGEGAAALLEVVYRANLFVLLVDDEARTYRYLHVIREVLRAELQANDPVRGRQLQKTAAKYLEDIGQVGPAARHLLPRATPAKRSAC